MKVSFCALGCKVKATEWLKTEMAAYYPLGVIKETNTEVK